MVTGEPARRGLPGRLRRILTLESGANDGLALPLVALASAAALPADDVAAAVPGAVVDVVGAGAVGGLVGALAAVGARVAGRHRELEPGPRLVQPMLLSVAVLGLALVIGVGGVLTVFVAGLADSGVLGGGPGRCAQRRGAVGAGRRRRGGQPLRRPAPARAVRRRAAVGRVVVHRPAGAGLRRARAGAAAPPGWSWPWRRPSGCARGRCCSRAGSGRWVSVRSSTCCTPGSRACLTPGVRGRDAGGGGQRGGRRCVGGAAARALRPRGLHRRLTGAGSGRGGLGAGDGVRVEQRGGGPPRHAGRRS